MIRLRDRWKAFARRIICALFDRPPETATMDMPRHIVVLRWDAKLGDTIVSSPFYREIRHLPNARVTVVTVAALAVMHERDFGVNRAIVTRARPGVLDLLRVLRQLNQDGPVDAVVHLVGRMPPREIVFLRLLRAARVYSLDTSLRLVSHKHQASDHSWRFGDHYLQVLRDLGVPNPRADYIVPMIANRGATGLDILFNPYGSRVDKSLSADKAVELLHALADAYPRAKIGILSARSTRAAAARLEQRVNRAGVRSLAHIDTPAHAAAAVSASRIVVSVDTAIVHMAVGLRKRLIAIYADTGAIPNPWLPPTTAEHRVVLSRHKLANYARTGIKDMNQFPVAEVIDATRSLYDANTVVVEGEIVSGLGAARGTLERQLPMISAGFPAVSGCFRGTLNVMLVRPLWVVRPDHRTAPLAWTPSGRTREVFDLLRVQLELIASRRYFETWLYVAHGSPHRRTPELHELIAGNIELNGETRCALTICAGAVSFTGPGDAQGRSDGAPSDQRLRPFRPESPIRFDVQK
ncbi:ADP-heptose:LPS heptosyltransferase [Paraburkholderia sp. GAS33]|jgi:ADP-heptose:LPS heptosyltransferase|uniref:glycosyltransferase family 9 protein n=1 Tax=Paraburkholderia sp. GAS33 TaxID=3035130 RepID=UPI003D1B2418